METSHAAATARAVFILREVAASFIRTLMVNVNLLL